MTEITLDVVKRLQNKMEEDILVTVKEFENLTGLSVGRISLSRVNVVGVERPYTVDVDTEVKL
jgi:hypothetical protein